MGSLCSLDWLLVPLVGRQLFSDVVFFLRAALMVTLFSLADLCILIASSNIRTDLKLEGFWVSFPIHRGQDRRGN